MEGSPLAQVLRCVFPLFSCNYCVQPKKKNSKEEWGGIVIEQGIMEISWKTEYAGNTVGESIPKQDNARKQRLLGRMRPKEKVFNATNFPKHRCTPQGKLLLEQISRVWNARTNVLGQMCCNSFPAELYTNTEGACSAGTNGRMCRDECAGTNVLGRMCCNQRPEADMGNQI